MPYVWNSGSAQNRRSSGAIHVYDSASAHSCPCVRASRFGRPVEPEENWYANVSSGSRGSIGRREWLAIMRSMSLSSASTSRVPQAFRQNASSSTLNCGLSGTTIAPMPVSARNAVASAGPFGSTSPTASPARIPRSRNASAIRSTRSSSSAWVMRRSPYTNASRSGSYPAFA